MGRPERERRGAGSTMVLILVDGLLMGGAETVRLATRRPPRAGALRAADVRKSLIRSRRGRCLRCGHGAAALSGRRVPRASTRTSGAPRGLQVPRTWSSTSGCRGRADRSARVRKAIGIIETNDVPPRIEALACFDSSSCASACQGCFYEVNGTSARRLKSSREMWRLRARMASRLVLPSRTRRSR